MRTLLSMVLIALIGFGAYWFFVRHKEEAEQARQKISTGATELSDSFKRQFDKYSVHAAELKKELAETGQIVREKARAAGAAVADAAKDAKITTEIKAKFVAEPDLSALKISVNTTQGVVTLSGTVSSYEAIGKAIAMAMETEGVYKVVSTLQIKK